MGTPPVVALKGRIMTWKDPRIDMSDPVQAAAQRRYNANQEICNLPKPVEMITRSAYITDDVVAIATDAGNIYIGADIYDYTSEVWTDLTGEDLSDAIRKS